MSDDWLREHALREKKEEARDTAAKDLHEREYERVLLIREQFPSVWQEFVSHLQRKVRAYNEWRGQDKFELDVIPGPQLTLKATSKGTTRGFVLQGNLENGSLTVRRVASDASHTEAHGDLTLDVDDDRKVALARKGERITPEEAADYLMRELLGVPEPS
jgi:hypothetical protein